MVDKGTLLFSRK